MNEAFEADQLRGEPQPAKLEIDEMDYCCKDEIVCPHCGYAHSDSREYGDVDGYFEMDCGECGKEFGVKRVYTISVTYTSCKPQKK